MGLTPKLPTFVSQAPMIEEMQHSTFGKSCQNINQLFPLLWFLVLVPSWEEKTAQNTKFGNYTSLPENKYTT